jgi:hypothetical protein
MDQHQEYWTELAFRLLLMRKWAIVRVAPRSSVDSHRESPYFAVTLEPCGGNT